MGFPEWVSVSERRAIHEAAMLAASNTARALRCAYPLDDPRRTDPAYNEPLVEEDS